jgi:hypothetical protein
LGAVLRLWQYQANSSLWIDEAALARNIIERPVADLDAPLRYAQVAPIGFLLIQKAVTLVAGASEYALRAFPLVCGLAGMFLFQRASRRVVSGWGVTFAVGLFAVGIPFVYFSSQVKQYSSDITAALVLLLLALDVRGNDWRPAARLAVAGVVIAWISQTALFVMAGIALALLLLAERDRRALFWPSIIVIVWGVTAVVVSVHSLSAVSSLDREYFRWFWAQGFMPFPPNNLEELGWLPSKLVWVFGAFGPGLGHTNGGLNYRWSPLFALVTIYGYWALWRTRKDAALFLLLPVLVAVGASAATLYPFTARLLAFIIPFFLLAVAAGASHLLASMPARLQFMSPLLLAILGGAPLYAIATALPPSRVQHLRPAIEHLQQQQRPGDRVYVYYGAGLAFGYYALRLGVPTEGVVRGRCAFDDPRRYLREIDSLRGAERVWLLMTHEYRPGERDLILGYLDRVGRRLHGLEIPASSGRAIEHASVHLYDLSAPAPAWAAETYPLPAALGLPSEGLKRWGCYGVTGGEPMGAGTP